MVLCERVNNKNKTNLLFCGTVHYVVQSRLRTQPSRSSLPGDVSRERRLRSHKFYTDDVDLSGIWSTSANVPGGDEREETAVFEGYVVQYFPKWMVVPKAFYQ